MLRRKMMMYLAGLVGLLLVASVAAIWMLQGVLGALDHTNGEDARVVETSNRMETGINGIEIDLREIQLGRERHLDSLVERIEALKADTADFGAQYQRPLPEARPVYQRIGDNLAVFEMEVGKLATAQDETLARPHTEAAISASIALRQDIWQAGRMMREHTAGEQRDAIARFRWVVLALAGVFLVVINASVMMMVRMARMVLRPVERLVEASRRLGREEFDYRVRLRATDEFGELAAAYNRLAEQLSANERRKLETLGQAAVMLNHELNNAGAIIKLQLQLLERQNSGNPAMARALRQIHESLARMTETVERLKHVRRIVLTDYTADTKMLDLERSVAETEPVKV
jgi:methyl-accepting chemotaxis protein